VIQWSTASLAIPGRPIDQVIGQDKAVQVMRLAARQRRFVLLVGEPGTGKSMLGRSMADLMPFREEKAVAVFANGENPISPIIRQMSLEELGQWEDQLEVLRRRERFANRYLIGFGVSCLLLVSLWFLFRDFITAKGTRSFDVPDLSPWAFVLGTFVAFTALWGVLWSLLRRRESTAHGAGAVQKFYQNPKTHHFKILYHPKPPKPPFVDATGFSEGALFGDVRHDPYQSGGRETPPHLLVEPGAVHKAHGGVLYIDEIGTLSPESQRLLLTAIQEKALPITGRHQGSSGTLIATEPVPCDFVLVAAGNHEDLEHLLPALRSRILGYGYEVNTLSVLPDREDGRDLIARFVAQEVTNDGKIPHFDQEAVRAIHGVARARACRPGFISARWRELGGLVRIAGDLASDEGAALVSRSHVRSALEFSRSLETKTRDQPILIDFNGAHPDGKHHPKMDVPAPPNRLFCDHKPSHNEALTDES
jgi:lon-related putative ATP-dependent protease